MRKKSSLSWAIVVWVFCLTSMPFVAVEAQASTPESEAKAFITNLADRAVATLTSPDIPEDQRVADARALLRENFAIPQIGRWILGRYWRTATPQERTEYMSLFEDMIISVYVERFDEYSGETLTVVDAVPAGSKGDILVGSRLNRAAGDPVKVGWRVRRMDSGLMVLDVVVAGVSLAQTQRAEFAAVIQRNGNRVEGLLEEMRARSAAIREGAG